MIQTAHEFKHDGFVMSSMSARFNFDFLRNRLTESFEVFEYKAVCLSDQQNQGTLPWKSAPDAPGARLK
jgi:hypothetical protein